MTMSISREKLAGQPNRKKGAVVRSNDPMPGTLKAVRGCAVGLRGIWWKAEVRSKEEKNLLFDTPIMSIRSLPEGLIPWAWGHKRQGRCA